MLAYMATSKKTVAKTTKASTQKVATKGRGRVAKPVTGYKILKTGKLGAAKVFASAKEAAEKVAPNSNPTTVAKCISRCILGYVPTAYGYKWSR